MYTVYCDGNLLYDPRVEELEIFDKRLKLEVNTTGAFDFKIYPKHPMYNAIKRLTSTIEVYQDNYRLFRGRVLDDEYDFYNAKNIICEGDLAFFNDSIIRPFEFQGSITEFLEWVINKHNEQVGNAQKFVLGNVTVETSTNYVNRSSINAMTSWEVITSRLLDLIGGFIRVRRENGTNYIDYLEDSNYRSLQEIRLGENLLDLNKKIKGQDIITALIPYGTRLEDEDGNETDERLTIESVNDGIDYVYNQEAVDEYGWIFGTDTWDDVTIAQNLLTRANQRLAELMDLKVSIEVNAVDLSMTSDEFDQFRFFEYVKVDSPTHLLDDWMLISKQNIDMENPANNTLTLGLDYATFTQRQLETETAIKNIDTIKGQPGQPGKSAYELAVENGFEGTEAEWLESLKGKDGEGIPGKPGEDGKPTYTWVKYADTPTSGMSDSPEGKNYIGLAFNKNTATESNNYADYQWSEMPQNIEIGGENLLKNSSDLSNLFAGGYGGATIAYAEVDMTEEWGFSEAYEITSTGGTSTLVGVWGTNAVDESRPTATERMLFDQKYTHSMWIKNTGETRVIIRTNGMIPDKTMSVEPGESKRLVFTGVRRTDYDWYQIHLLTVVDSEGKNLDAKVVVGRMKLEKGTKATDWKPSNEDIQDQIDEKADNDYVTEVETSLNSNIEQEADAIRSEVERNYTAISEFETYQESQSTQYEQLYDSFNFTFKELVEQIDILDGETKAQFEEIVKYIRFVDGNIVLGEVGNEVTLRMTNNRIQFLQNGAEVAYFSDNMLYVTDIRVLNSLLIGAFGFYPRANGSLDFK